MKAFGVRLAAGAVTIVMGAVMAAQSQKEQQASTDSAWTEQQIPPGKAVSPIGSAGVSSPDGLNPADPNEVKSLKPLEDSDLAGTTELQEAPEGVLLVQHTEDQHEEKLLPADSPSMTFPTGAGEASEAKDSADAAAGPAGMSIKMPDFDSAPPLDLAGVPTTEAAETGAASQGSDSDSAESPGPSFAMGGLVVEAADAKDASPSATMSGVTFAETSEMESLSVSETSTASPSSATIASDAPSAGAQFNPMRGGTSSAGDSPSNTLRAGTPSELSAMPPAPTFADDSEATPSRGSSEGSAMGLGAAALSAAVVGSGVAASDAPAAASPAKITGFTPPAGSELAGSELGATGFPGEAVPTGVSDASNPMRSSMQIKMGSPTVSGEPMTASAAVEAEATTPPATTQMGISSQPRLVGDPSAASQGNQFRQTAGQGSQGFASPAGGFEAPGSGYPATAAAAPQGHPTPAPAAGMRGIPNLPAPSMAGTGFDTPAHPALAAEARGAAGANAMGTPATFTAPGAGSVYQEAGFKTPRAAAPVLAGPTLASPGERYLDGPQTPSVVIEKRAPAEVKVGKPASFVITVRNVGNAKALNVQVFDRVPTGMTLTDATPRPDPQHQPELFWDLGDMEPNQERTITLQMMPEQEGELGSVARVTFQAAASVRTISTRPELKVVQRAREKVLIGQQLEIELEVSNPGTGEATGVVLQEDVPEGLEHPQGKQLDNAIGRLGPGEIRRQILRMRAVKPGLVQNKIRVKGDDGLETTHTVAVEVIAPELKVSLSGPSRRYLERQATYNLEIANVGTADATNVEISVQLDRGFTFVKTDYEGQYDPSRHAVFWSLPALPVGQSGKVPLTLLPVEEGQRVLVSEASADLGVRSANETKVLVDSLAELTFSINDSADPIEVGGQTTYEIRIKNSGSRDDTNVKVALQLPPGLQLAEQGDFTSQGQGVVTFSPRAMLKADDEIVYHVKALGAAPGRHLVKAIVTSDQSDVPVTKEESIMVYSDQ